MEDFEAINAELKQYSPELAGRKMIGGRQQGGHHGGPRLCSTGCAPT
ncbi:MAG: hypothetical protein ACLRWQ_16505 [Flavonifractor plautii]